MSNPEPEVNSEFNSEMNPPAKPDPSAKSDPPAEQDCSAEQESSAEANFIENLTNDEKLDMLQEAVLTYHDNMLLMQDELDAGAARLQRSQADLENYKKRAKKDKEIAVQDVTRSFLRKLIPIMDNIDYAIEAINSEQEALVEPLQMIRNAFLDTLKDYSVSRIEPQEGDVFNPEIHQAISVMLSDDVTQQVVGHVGRIGYAIGEHVFRPSDVVVLKPK